MSRLEDFLALPNVGESAIEVHVNDRLGIFKLKPMTIEQQKDYQDRCRIRDKKGNTSGFDVTKYNLLITIGQTIDPDFRNADFLGAAGFPTASDFVKAKILPGELSVIANKIWEISGFDTDIEEVEEEVKN